MKSLKQHVKPRWYWLLPFVAVAVNVYGFVGFPDLTDLGISEAAAQRPPWLHMHHRLLRNRSSPQRCPGERSDVAGIAPCNPR